MSHFRTGGGARAVALSLQCLEKRLVMASWRLGSDSNVLLRFAQLSDPGNNQWVMSREICNRTAKQHLLSLFWIYFSIWKSWNLYSQFFIFRYRLVFSRCFSLFNSSTMVSINIHFKNPNISWLLQQSFPSFFPLLHFGLSLWSALSWHVNSRSFIESSPHPFREFWNDSTQHHKVAQISWFFGGVGEGRTPGRVLVCR